MVSSYSVNIIGGVPQIHRSGQQGLKKDGMTQSTQSLLRHKKDRHGTRRRIFGANRRISCKDLGNGDCQGWLFKRKDGGSGVLASKWVKLWFVLKGSDMYYYKSQDDERARGIIHLPGFQIKPAPEMKSSKLVFKAEHSGTSFFFASERQDDMAKWMNKMGLASIQVATGENEIQPPFNKPSIIEENPGALHSESEDEEDGESLDAVDQHPTPEDTALEKEFESIRREKLIDPLTNQDRHRNRVSHLQQVPEGRMPSAKELQEMERMRKLTSLQRTLKDKEAELEELDTVLTSDMSAAVLEQFRKEHASLFTPSQQADSTSDPSLSEGEESGAVGMA